MIFAFINTLILTSNENDRSITTLRMTEWSQYSIKLLSNTKENHVIEGKHYWTTLWP